MNRDGFRHKRLPVSRKVKSSSGRPETKLSHMAVVSTMRKPRARNYGHVPKNHRSHNLR